MNIFMTGATGYLGRSIASRISAAGHHVRCLARSEQAAHALGASGFDVVRGELAEVDVLRHEAARADAVVHAAFQSDGPDFAAAAALDASATRVILEALRGRSRFVYTSGTVVMGDTGDTALDESASPRPPEFAQWRADLERDLVAAREAGVVTTVVRPPLVYGAAGNRMLEMLKNLSLQAGAGRIVGDGKNRWSTVHVDDLADLYLRVVEAPPASPVVIASSGEVGLRELATALSELLGFSGRVSPWPLADAMTVLGPFAAAIAMNQRVSGAYAKSLGWSPTRPSLVDELASGSYRAWRPV